MKLKAFKYRIYPNTKQKELICQFFGCSRFLYNNLLSWYKNAYEIYKKENISIGKLPLVTFFKKDFTFLKECDDSVLMNARRNFEIALSNYFNSKNGKRKGKKSLFPTFKKKGVGVDSYKTNTSHNNIHFKNELLKLPKVGLIKIKKHREIEGRIISATVSKTKDNKYYVSIITEVEDLKYEKREIKPLDKLSVVGLDMSMDSFVISSNQDDNTKTKYVRLYRKNEKKISKLQKKMSKSVNGSNNRLKRKNKLAKLSSHIANQRKDFCIKQALYYSKKYDIIMLEDLNMQNMSQSLRLGKSTNDLGFGIFKTWLKHQCIKHDSSIIYVDKWFASSKLCHECGSKNSLLKLSDREWVCPTCGCLINRDLNASLNIRDYYYQIIGSTVGTTETDIETNITAFGDESPTLRSYVIQVLSLKKEAPSFRLE